MEDISPSLFGLHQTNKNFSLKEAWGKNQFNSSFPAALCCYLESRSITANYIAIKSSSIKVVDININEAFGIPVLGDDIFFEFETAFDKFKKYTIDSSLPRTDLVIKNKKTGEHKVALEIKLTAIPDNSTYSLEEKKYGAELVIRPDSIVYLACSLAENLGPKIIECVSDFKNLNWSDINEVIDIIPQILKDIKSIALIAEKHQSAFLMQPIWKTIAKSSILAENCLDVFFWSDAALTSFISKIITTTKNNEKITRQTRTAIWLFKMLAEIKDNGTMNYRKIIDELSYDTKNDKAFASSGMTTYKFMCSPRLEKPIIQKNEISSIIIGGGEKMLSPERRFDAIICNTPEIFQ